jgi:hypothetical protein
MLLHSQNRKDAAAFDKNQNLLIEKSLTFKPLIQKLGREPLYCSQGYLIQDHGISFTNLKELKIENKAVLLINKEDLKKNSYAAYFLFHTLSIENETALVRLQLITKNQKAATPLTIQFKKVNGLWEEVNYKFEF